MHRILFYEYADDVLERRGPYRERHLERIRAEQAAGRIVLAGALGDPPHGAAIVFRDVPLDKVEAFAGEDPYMTAGLVRDWRVEPWAVV